MRQSRAWNVAAVFALAALGCGEARPPSDGPSNTATCPAIACAGGARLKFDFPFAFAEARDATFEACRNDLCYTSKLEDADAEPPAGSAVGFRAPPVGTDTDDDFVEVTVLNDGDARGLALQMWWWPNDNRTLHDGDRYSLTMSAGGAPVVFLDELAKYSEFEIGTRGEPCYQQCLVFNEDRRGQRLPGDL